MKRSTNIFLVIVLLGVVLRIYRLDALSIWIDELFTLLMVSDYFNYIVHYLAYTPGMFNNVNSPLFTGYLWHGLNMHQPLYFTILAYVSRFFGMSIIHFRLVSALFGIGSVVVMYYFTRLLYVKKVALLSSFLLAVSPIHVLYAQEARPYTIVIFFFLCASYFFYRAVHENEWHLWMLYVFFTFLALLSHTYAYFYTFSHFLYFFSPRGFSSLEGKRYISCLLLIVVLLLPWLPHLYYQQKFAFTVFNLQRNVNLIAGFHYLNVLAYVLGMFITFAFGKTLIDETTALPLLGIGFLVFILLYGVAYYKGMRKNFGEKEIFLLYIMLVPIVITFVPTFFTSTNLLVLRYLLISSLPFLIFVARGIMSYPKKVAMFTLLCIMVLSSVSLSRYYSQSVVTKAPYREVSDFIVQNQKSGDAIMVRVPLFKYALLYYHPELSVIELGKWETKHIHEVDLQPIVPLFGQYDRYWVMVSHTYDEDKLNSFFSKYATLEKKWESPGVNLYLYRHFRNLPPV